MSNIYFSLYRNNIIKLARSVVVKLDDVAAQINKMLEEDGFTVDPNQPETWKYFLNMSGEYHESDVLMQVKSADTLEIIDFTKENLSIHRATAREYYPGSQLYETLARQYPTQVPLINGILFPIDIEVAISSNNGVILYYDSNLVEQAEDYFIFELQDFVTAYITRWYNPQFNLIDDLYLAMFIADMFRNMVMAIIILHLKHAKTNKANSYHIREYLASHGNLDIYMPYLDVRQRLWLYRNIDFLARNVGKRDTWQRLVDNILTPRGVPLIEYQLEQNTTNMLENLKPSVDMIRRNINYPIVQEGQEKVTVGEVLEREDPLARDNALIRNDAEREIIDRVSRDKYSQLPTKVLDSEVIDRSNSSVRRLINVLLNEWLHLSSSGKYRAYVRIPNPRTGEFMQMSVKDAYIVVLYCWTKTREIEVDSIPRVIAYEVLRDKMPTFDELRWISNKKIIPDKIITAIQDMVIPMGSYISTEQFYYDCVRTHTQYLKQWEMYSLQEDPNGRAGCENLVKYHYMHRMCTLVDEDITFEDYLKRMAINITDLTDVELNQLCVDAVNIATGSDLVTVITLGEIQKELLNLMGDLSSYPLQYLRNVSYTDFHVLGMVVPRVGDITAEADGNLIVPVANLNVKSYKTAAQQQYNIYDDESAALTNFSYESYGNYWINPFVNVVDRSMREVTYWIPGADINVNHVTIEPDNNNPTDGNLDIYVDPNDPTWPKLETQ